MSVHGAEIRRRVAHLVPALPDDAPRWWPRFTGTLHGEALTARVGRVLAITFTICFVTGLISHVHQHPLPWLEIPGTPSWGYRVTQGLHVITGLVTIPLLLLKLWTVYPLFWAWPPAPTLLRAVERLTLGVLVASSLFELLTGFLNILGWYPWHFGFVQTHFWVAWVVAGSILLHVAVKLPAIRRGLATPLDSPVDSPAAPAGPDSAAVAEPPLRPSPVNPPAADR